MSLIVPMYHRASAGRHGNDAALLDAHFAWIAAHCRSVLPGDPLSPDRQNVCLSFDDGYVDFHAVVFPLLVRHGLRALLAVPIAAIDEKTTRTAADRLAACAARRSDARDAGAHCTWDEIAAMVASGTVVVAAHGFSHRRLDGPGIDLATEIALPKAVLETRLATVVDSYVLPYGRFTPTVLDEARRHYRYVFRIGSADNAGWDGCPLYRIDADEMDGPSALFSRARVAGFRWRRRWNALRRR